MNNRKIIGNQIIKVILQILLISLFQTNFIAIAQEGTLKWIFQGCGGSPAIGVDGTIYCEGDGLVAVNPDGTQKWVFPDVVGPPVIGVDGTIYCVGDGLVAINPDGTQKWVFPDADDPPAIGSDRTIYATGGNTLYAVNPDGTQKWSFTFEFDPNPCDRPDLFLGLNLTKTAIRNDGTIYVRGGWACDNEIGGHTLYLAIDIEGQLIWFLSMWGRGLPQAIGEDGTIYGTELKHSGFCGFYAINPDGTSKWGIEESCEDYFPRVMS